MNPIRFLARPMLASMFVVGGLDALADPASKVPAAKEVTPTVKDTVPQVQDWNTETMVQANGAVQVIGGALLALGKLPRLASAALAASLVPTTLAGHRFWEESDEEARANQQIHFFKNVSMLGGLLITAMDTEGEPSIAWRARHAKEHAQVAAEHTKREAKLASKLARAEAKQAEIRARKGLEAATARSRREAKLAAKLAKAQAKRGGAEVRRGVAEAKRTLTPDITDLASGIRKLRDRDDDAA